MKHKRRINSKRNDIGVFGSGEGDRLTWVSQLPILWHIHVFKDGDYRKNMKRKRNNN